MQNASPSDVQPRAETSHVVPAALVLWLAVAVVAGGEGWLEALRPPGPQLVLLILTAGALVATAKLPAVRTWAWSIDFRYLVGLHLARFVGAYFLVLYRRGELPYAFAVPGGWGDILVASAALILLMWGPSTGSQRRRVYRVWNLFGLADILLVVATAARLGIADPESMRPLVRLPLSLLPTFLVPLVITSHVVIARRLSVRRVRTPEHHDSSERRHDA
jgi:hypothetical protein